MAAGQNIARLATSVAGMSPTDVDTSRVAWEGGMTALSAVEYALLVAAPEVLDGFGADSDIGKRAKAVLDAMRTEVIEPRKVDMKRAANALQDVHDEMQRSQKTDRGMPGSAPGPAPTYQGTTGETHEDITALKIYAAQMRNHNNQVNAYGDADEKARQQVEQLNKTYNEAARVMAEIHGEPMHTPGSPGAPSGGGGGTPPTAPPPVAPPPTSTPPRTPILTPITPPITPPVNPVVPPYHPVEPPIGQPPVFEPPVYEPTDPGVHLPETGGPGDVPVLDPVTSLPPTPGGGDTPGTGGGFPTSAALGVAGGGLLGALGVKGAAAAISSYASRGASAGVVGASTRASAGGVLGRGGAVGGQSVGRGGAAGAGGRGAGVGGTGGRGNGRGAGGRGAGARGAAGAGAGGRRGKNDKEQGRESDYDVEEDWTDDEGSPSVLS